MTSDCGFIDFTVIGPVPTGSSAFVNVVGSLTFDQTCSGTICTADTVENAEAPGVENFRVTSSSPVAATEERPVCQTPWGSRTGYFLSRLKENATSAAVNGSPSFHFTPCRVLNTSVLGSVHA